MSTNHEIETEEEVRTKEEEAGQPRHDGGGRLALILDHVSDIVFLLGVEPEETYRFEFVNPPFLAATGMREEQVLGRRVQEVIPVPAHALVLSKYAEAIRERRPAEWEETSAYPSGERVGEVRVVPIFDPQGRCTHLLGVVRDVTERRRAEAELRAAYARESLVSRIGQALLATTDPAAIQGRAAALLGEALGADRCYLSSWDAAGDHIVVPRDYHRADLPTVAGEYSAPQYAPVMDALFARGTAVVPDVRASDLPDDVIAMMTGFSLNSVLAVPFFERGGRIDAALMVAMADAPRAWTLEEVALAATVAALTRTAVEAARVHQREHRIAEQLQAALQPPTPASVPGMRLAEYYRPAWEDQGVGGDFSDVFSDAGGTFLVVGDLSGKGLAAASQVASVRHMLRFSLYNGRSVAGPVTALNRTLADHDLLTGFATLFVGRYDHLSRRLTYVNCGQDAGLILRAATGEIRPLPPTGPVLGAFNVVEYREETVELEPEDALAVYTDGLTEAGPSRSELLTGEGVADLLRGLVGVTDPRHIVERLMAGVDAYAGSGARDDQCLLIGVLENGI